MTNPSPAAPRNKNPRLTLTKLMAAAAFFIAFFQATHSALLMLVTGQLIGSATGHTGGHGTIWLFAAAWLPTFLVQFLVWFFILGIVSIMVALLYAIFGVKQMSKSLNSDNDEKPAANPLRTIGKCIFILDLIVTIILVSNNMVTEVIFGQFANASTIQLVLLFISGWLASFPIFLFVLGGMLSIFTAMVVLIIAFFHR